MNIILERRGNKNKGEGHFILSDPVNAQMLVNLEGKKIFEWFVDQVTEARRQGDTHKEKAILADVFKLLGNSCYGKFIEALERQTDTTYTKNENEVDRSLRSSYFEDLEEIGEAYEITKRKEKIMIDRPFQIGIAVYQLAKLRMLEFYYDFLDKFIDRCDYELIQMDTDSNYIAISGEKLEDVIKPELLKEFEACKKEWLAWDKFSKRTPGLFKLEFEGDRAIALCSKAYFVEKVEGERNCKHSAKGVSARQNALTWERYKTVLEGNIDKAENRGFRMVDGTMRTYTQKKLGLSAYYDKRYVLDGIHTQPLEYIEKEKEKLDEDQKETDTFDEEELGFDDDEMEEPGFDDDEDDDEFTFDDIYL